MEKALTLMVTMYNSEKVLHRTLNSITPQLTLETELVIVDDGSRDKSYELAKELTLNLVGCKVIKQDNKGSIVARKTGFDNSTGKYCWAIDCGDTINNGSINVVLNNIKNNQHDIYICNTTTVESTKKYTTNTTITNEPIKDLLLGKITPSLWSKIIKTDLLYKTYNQDVEKIKLATDLYVSCDALSQTDDICLIKENLYTYIVESNSMTTSRKNELGIIHSIRMAKSAIIKNMNYDLFKEEFEYFVFNQLIINFIFMRKDKRYIDIFYEEYKKYKINEKKNKYIGKKALIIKFIKLEKLLPFKDSILKRIIQ